MTADTKEKPRYDASATADRAGWIARMDEIFEDDGYFQPLGEKHFAIFADEGSTLFVTFESLEAIQARPNRMPWGFETVARNGWSHLCIVAEGETWYRDPAVWQYFDRLVDDAFFEDFDRVVFYGSDMGGYAACAYSVCAPGASVIAIRPRATLAPEIANWDRRNLAARRLDFTRRYGYAPDMTEGTGEVFVVYDPYVPEDAAHAALFTRPFTTKLRMPFIGNRVEGALLATQIMPRLIDAAGKGILDAAFFAREWRIRRKFGPYLKAVLAHTDRTGALKRSLMVCRSVTSRLNAPQFMKRRIELEKQLNTPTEKV